MQHRNFVNSSSNTWLPYFKNDGDSKSDPTSQCLPRKLVSLPRRIQVMDKWRQITSEPKDERGRKRCTFIANSILTNKSIYLTSGWTGEINSTVGSDGSSSTIRRLDKTWGDKTNWRVDGIRWQELVVETTLDKGKMSQVMKKGTTTLTEGFSHIHVRQTIQNLSCR